MKDSNDLTFSEKKTKKMLYGVIGRKISEARKSSRRKLEGISKKLNISTDILKKIESGEIEFGEAAKKYSDGPEAKTQGIIGPCDLTVPHPDISSRLRTASPKQLFKPFLIDKWVAILRLEYRFDSEFNNNTKEILGKLIFGSKIKPISSEIYNESITKFVG